MTVSPTAWIHRDVHLSPGVSVGHATVIGEGVGRRAPQLGAGVTIGAFCVVHWDTYIGPGVDVDHYCRIGSGVKVGSNSRILYGSQLFSNSVVGDNCIVGGDLSERVVLENDVTFMGSIAHTHRDPRSDWDTTDEPSPVFRRGCVVGVEALIVGGVEIGEGSYIAAREIVRTDVPPGTVVAGGQWRRLDEWRGFIRSRLER